MVKEICLLLLTYFMPVFTDYVDDPLVRYDCGFVMTGLFLAVVAVNLFVVAKDSLKKARLKLKHCLYNKTGKRGRQLVLAYEARKQKNNKSKVADSEVVEQSNTFTAQDSTFIGLKADRDPIVDTVGNVET